MALPWAGVGCPVGAGYFAVGDGVIFPVGAGIFVVGTDAICSAGSGLIPYMPFIECDVVTLEECPVFLLKGFLVVVFALVGDVLANGFNMGF